MFDPEPQSPEWWLHRLHERLKDQRAEIILSRRYYDGEFDLPFVPRELQGPYRTMLERSRSNFCRLVVDAVEERLRVEGFRLSASTTPQADDRAWEIWQANGLDSQAPLAFNEALVKARAYWAVWVPEEPGGYPIITVEDPLDTIVEYVPGSRRKRAAGLRVWLDDWTGEQRANLYLPDRVVKFHRPNDSSAEWARFEGDGAVRGEVRNPLGVVPIVPMFNRPSLKGMGQSELADVMVIQDRINETLFNRALASWTAAYRQKWATGLEVPEDEDGNPIEPFKAAVDRLWVAEDPDVRFGSFEATDLHGFIDAIEQDVLHLAVLTRTPRHYLVAQGQSPSGDAMNSAESGLVAKCRRRQADFGETLEEVLRLARIADGATDTPVDSEVVWADPEFISEQARVDSLVKMATLGVPQEALWERWGASPTEIKRWKRQQAQQALMASLSHPPTATEPEAAAEDEEPEEEQ